MQIIAIEGISGVGKSTLAQHLQRGLAEHGVAAEISGGLQTASPENFVTVELRRRLKDDRFLRLQWETETACLALEMWMRVRELQEQGADWVLYENYEAALWAFQLARAAEENVPEDSSGDFLRRIDSAFVVPPALGTVYLQAPGDGLRKRLEGRGDTQAPYGANEEQLQASVEEMYEEMQMRWRPWMPVQTNEGDAVDTIIASVDEWTRRKKQMIYLAGPLYTPGQREQLEKLARDVERLGATTYLPHRDGGLAGASEDDTRTFFDADGDALDSTDLVVATLDGHTVDPGTAWEVGYAYRRGIPCVGLLQDTRVGHPSSQINLMVLNSCPILAYEELLQHIGGFVNVGG